MKAKNINAMQLLLLITFFSFLVININVTYFGDDYHFLDFQNYNLQAYFSKLVDHYFLDNGRLIVHFLDTIFLSLPIFLWQILNSLMLTGICYFITKIVQITFDKKENNFFVFSIVFILIASLDIEITRQSVYWITGSFNYVYPLFIFFIYWYNLLNIDNSKTSFVIAIITGFLASASVEQVGMMSLGLTFLLLFARNSNLKIFDLSKFFKNNYKLLVLVLINVLGLATVLLAPSQFIRLNSGEEINGLDLMIENSKFLINNYTSVKNILAYCILFNLTSIVYALNNMKNGKIGSIILCALNVLFTVICTFGIKYASYSIEKILLILLILITYAITLFVINKRVFNKLISPLTISVILFIGSQIMMIISPVLGYRNLLPGLIMFSFIVALIAGNLNVNSRILGNISAILIFTALIYNLNTTKGYHQTKIIDEQNIAIINEYNGEETISLEKFKDDKYGWSMPYLSPFHEVKFKEFYNISGDIIWE